MSIGETLATKRQDAGLTVTQVSERTRIRETVIRGIERDDFSACGGNFYARGHVRSIARVIGLDPEPLVREYDDTHGGAPQAVSAAEAFEPETPVRFRERRSPNWSAAMAVALILVLIYGVVHAFGSDGQQRKPIRADQASRVEPGKRSASPAPATSAPVAMASRKKVTVRVDARRASWVNVRDGSGTQLFSGLVRSGASKEWSAKKKIRILIGNGGGVKLTVNGKDLGSPGSDGQVLRLSFGPGDPETA
ncbi:helix-turn-helix domain-containing protein [Actinomadura scrupuli]|uniref:helix-turn-helix domain-containing protein n=1 Tax=Actinomadura scrupuli TaxID=559629 RepID=UPI003D98D2CD